MSKREEIVTGFYSKYDEETRLTKSRQGQLEYAVTMEYINRYYKKGDKVLDIGAGTGRYSEALAKEGAEVSAIELSPSNVEVLMKRSEKYDNLHAYQGDALDLSRFEDETFDITLLFGPMYHLYEEADVNKAIEEAKRVTKKGGVILVAFLSAHAIMMTNYLYQWGTFTDGFNENFGEDFKIKHFKEQLFTGYDVKEFEDMFAKRGVEHITTVAVDNVLEIAERRADFNLSDEDYKTLLKYQLHFCETRELLGSSSHLLYICRK